MESPFYLTIPLAERYLLMKSLVKDYPSLFKNKMLEDMLKTFPEGKEILQEGNA
jgi:hypothetical protein